MDFIPMLQDYLLKTLLIAPPVLLALTVHECAHAWTACKMGDPTAKMMGRVTLNPLKHLAPIGTVALFVSGMFGWAKPVPINPRNFRNISKGITLVSLAGPLSNVFLAAVFALVRRLLLMGGDKLAFTAPQVFKPIYIMVEVSIVLNVSLAVFNMIPVPPLDGSRVLANFLPPDKAFAFSKIEPYGFMILIVLIMSGVINRVVSPLVFFTAGLLTGGFF
ncbi:MAG: site-2 protease family protein [Deltaproteobacteria bacterium]|nr:site-2 protease family protein [Deltaproteobacteria bacterium]